MAHRHTAAAAAAAAAVLGQLPVRMQALPQDRAEVVGKDDDDDGMVGAGGTVLTRSHLLVAHCPEILLPHPLGSSFRKLGSERYMYKKSGEAEQLGNMIEAVTV